MCARLTYSSTVIIAEPQTRTRRFLVSTSGSCRFSYCKVCTVPGQPHKSPSRSPINKLYQAQKAGSLLSHNVGSTSRSTFIPWCAPTSPLYVRKRLRVTVGSILVSPLAAALEVAYLCCSLFVQRHDTFQNWHGACGESCRHSFTCILLTYQARVICSHVETPFEADTSVFSLSIPPMRIAYSTYVIMNICRYTSSARWPLCPLSSRLR